MTVFGFPINDGVAKILASHFMHIQDMDKANELMHNLSGIVDFFTSPDELLELQSFIDNHVNYLHEPDRTEYGDFQTNVDLAFNVCKLLKSKGINPELIIEPTCGKGSFIIASLQTFESIREIVGIEIYREYIWHTKFSILEFFVKFPEKVKPEIRIYHQNVFDFDFKSIQSKGNQILVIGNPPWVTNAMLSSLNSDNIPRKSNFKNHAGLDAMTGKGNFDIGEYISIMLLKTFQHCVGHFAFLVKNTVVKNVVFEQKRQNLYISSLEKYLINAPKEFGAAVEASLFLAQLKHLPEYTCKEFDFYSRQDICSFGWVKENYVSNIEYYTNAEKFDGISPFEWRQGVKHDCSKVMEFEVSNEQFVNGKGSYASLEPDLIYGLLKSSDLKHQIISQSRKYTIITQRKVGQQTQHIQQTFPKTWKYLTDHYEDFAKRKSSIYKDKPAFSIFGIGDYAFLPYKVAISGLYKTSKFTLVLPDNGKPLMLDDTCYFLGFSNYAAAVFTLALLNAPLVQTFMQSIVFWDSKRAISKDVLMRLDLCKIALTFDYNSIIQEVEKIQGVDSEFITLEEWENYRIMLSHQKSAQLTIF